jgi:MoxR-like ATPase
VLSRVPELPEALVDALVRTVRVLRGLELRKAPSVAETIDWGRTLLALGMDTLDADAVRATLGVVLKHRSDADRAVRELRLEQDTPGTAHPGR